MSGADSIFYVKFLYSWTLANQPKSEAEFCADEGGYVGNVGACVEKEAFVGHDKGISAFSSYGLDGVGELLLDRSGELLFEFCEILLCCFAELLYFGIAVLHFLKTAFFDRSRSIGVFLNGLEVGIELVDFLLKFHEFIFILLGSFLKLSLHCGCFGHCCEDCFDIYDTEFLSHCAHRQSHGNSEKDFLEHIIAF